MTLFLVSTNEQDVINANNQIGSNCGLPTQYTSQWDRVLKAYDQDFWFIIKPPVQGWNEFSQAQMMQGVTNVTEEESQPDWWPPVVPPEGKR